MCEPRFASLRWLRVAGRHEAVVSRRGRSIERVNTTGEPVIRQYGAWIAEMQPGDSALEFIGGMRVVEGTHPGVAS